MILKNNNSALLFLSTFILLTTFAFSKTIIVSNDGKIKTITEAISIASNSDTIIVRKGEYAEGNIIVDKKVTLIGEEFPVIDGKGVGEIFTVTSNDVHISGLLIKNSGISYLEENAGIRLKEVRNCSILNNKFINNFFAVYLAKSADCKIAGNYITGVKKRETNSGNGIHLWYCRDITVELIVIKKRFHFGSSRKGGVLSDLPRILHFGDSGLPCQSMESGMTIGSHTSLLYQFNNINPVQKITTTFGNKFLSGYFTVKCRNIQTHWASEIVIMYIKR